MSSLNGEITGRVYKTLSDALKQENYYRYSLPESGGIIERATLYEGINEVYDVILEAVMGFTRKEKQVKKTGNTRRAPIVFTAAWVAPDGTTIPKGTEGWILSNVDGMATIDVDGVFPTGRWIVPSLEINEFTTVRSKQVRSDYVVGDKVVILAGFAIYDSANNIIGRTNNGDTGTVVEINPIGQDLMYWIAVDGTGGSIKVESKLWDGKGDTDFIVPMRKIRSQGAGNMNYRRLLSKRKKVTREGGYGIAYKPAGTAQWISLTDSFEYEGGYSLAEAEKILKEDYFDPQSLMEWHSNDDMGYSHPEEIPTINWFGYANGYDDGLLYGQYPITIVGEVENSFGGMVVYGIFEKVSDTRKRNLRAMTANDVQVGDTLIYNALDINNEKWGTAWDSLYPNDGYTNPDEGLHTTKVTGKDDTYVYTINKQGQTGFLRLDTLDWAFEAGEITVSPMGTEDILGRSKTMKRTMQRRVTRADDLLIPAGSRGQWGMDGTYLFNLPDRTVVKVNEASVPLSVFDTMGDVITSPEELAAYSMNGLTDTIQDFVVSGSDVLWVGDQSSYMQSGRRMGKTLVQRKTRHPIHKITRSVFYDDGLIQLDFGGDIITMSKSPNQDQAMLDEIEGMGEMQILSYLQDNGLSGQNGEWLTFGASDTSGLYVLLDNSQGYGAWEHRNDFEILRPVIDGTQTATFNKLDMAYVDGTLEDAMNEILGYDEFEARSAPRRKPVPSLASVRRAKGLMKAPVRQPNRRKKITPAKGGAIRRLPSGRMLITKQRVTRSYVLTERDALDIINVILGSLAEQGELLDYVNLYDEFDGYVPMIFEGEDISTEDALAQMVSMGYLQPSSDIGGYEFTEKATNHPNADYYVEVNGKVATA